MRGIALFALMTLGVSATAQQNFINVPSSDVTAQGKCFFQEQLNFNSIFQSNSTFDYGIGHQAELGVNILGLDYSSSNKSWIVNDTNDRDPYDPLLTVNGMKRIALSEHAALAMGGQAGVNYDRFRIARLAGLAYCNLRLDEVLIEHGVLVVGPYYNSQHYGGEGNRLGAWLGAEVPFNRYLRLVAESVLGNNAISATSLGLVVYPIKRMPLTLGVQIPNTDANAYSIVFELTVVP